MAEGIECGGVAEDVEVELGEIGVVMEAILEEGEEVLGCEGGFEVGFEEVG